MLNQIEILEARLKGVIDSTIYKGFSIKKAQNHVKIKAEILFPEINQETMEKLLNYTKQRLLLNKALEDLDVAIFKQRHQIKQPDKPIIEEIEVENE